jgi:hypothetical protein
MRDRSDYNSIYSLSTNLATAWLLRNIRFIGQVALRWVVVLDHPEDFGLVDVASELGQL